MDTALPQKFPFILDRNLAKANCTRVCTSCDTVVLGEWLNARFLLHWKKNTCLLSHMQGMINDYHPIDWDNSVY